MAEGKPKPGSIATVSEQAVWSERIKKEMRHHQLQDSYHINPLKPTSLLTGKPNALDDYIDVDLQDDTLKSLMHEAQKPPTQKYSQPQTSAQEIGWISTPLLEVDRSDIRLYHGKQLTDVTKSKEVEWMQQPNQWDQK